MADEIKKTENAAEMDWDSPIEADVGSTNLPPIGEYGFTVTELEKTLSQLLFFVQKPRNPEMARNFAKKEAPNTKDQVNFLLIYHPPRIDHCQTEIIYLLFSYLSQTSFIVSTKTTKDG